MADNEFNTTKVYGIQLDQRRTKLSHVRAGRWAFFDPNSLNWRDANAKVSYAVIADRDIGIVTQDKFQPEQYIDIVKRGDTLVRSVDNGVFVYHKLPEGAEL